MKHQLEVLCNYITTPGLQIMRQWQWGQGVVIYALDKAYRKTGNEEYIKFIKQWVDSQLEEEIPGYSINTTAALNGVLTMYGFYGDEKYMYLCEEFAQYLMGENARCERGGFEHTCTGNYCPNQMWVDTVFMCGIFLVRYGKIKENPMYIKEALRQLILHFDFLHEPENDLLYHGYYSDDRKTHGVLWGRGNSWYSAACGIILEELNEATLNIVGDESMRKLKAEVEKRYIRHLNAALKFQREDGGWGTVINEEDSYTEMSGTAGFTYGIAKGIEMGYIGEENNEKLEMAYKCLASNIGKMGEMTHGSDGTCVMEGADKYKAVKFRVSEFTQGLAILAFSA